MILEQNWKTNLSGDLVLYCVPNMIGNSLQKQNVAYFEETILIFQIIVKFHSKISKSFQVYTFWPNNFSSLFILHKQLEMQKDLGAKMVITVPFRMEKCYQSDKVNCSLRNF